MRSCWECEGGSDPQERAGILLETGLGQLGRCDSEIQRGVAFPWWGSVSAEQLKKATAQFRGMSYWMCSKDCHRDLVSELGLLNRGLGKRDSVMSAFHSWNCRREGYRGVFSENENREK